MSCYCSGVADTTGSVLLQRQNVTKINSAQGLKPSPPVMRKQVVHGAESSALQLFPGKISLELQPLKHRAAGTSVEGAALSERHFSTGAGIKAQVCSLMELLTTTLYQAHALFYTMPGGMPPDPALPCGLLFSTLESTTGQQPAGEHPGSAALGLCLSRFAGRRLPVCWADLTMCF